MAGAKGKGIRLSRDQAEEIRVRYALGDVAQTALAAEYGVSSQAVSMIVNGHVHTVERKVPYTREEALERRRRGRLAIDYGITWEEWERMLEQAGHACEICRTHVDDLPPHSWAPGRRSLACDHDHDTGKVRGVLCARCNSMLGFANDDPRILEAAMKYLALHGKAF